MKYRSIDDIYPIWHPRSRDARELERIVSRRMHCRMSDVSDLTSWIERESQYDCYDREALAVTLHLYIQSHNDPTDEDCLLIPDYLREQLEGDLMRIVRHAQSDEEVAEMNMLDEEVNPEVKNENPEQLHEHLANLDKLVAIRGRDIEDLKERISRLEAEKKDGTAACQRKWPYYTAEATEEQKDDFEHYLGMLASSRKRSATGDIKAYLQMKVQAGLIVRPEQINAEYELVRRFGYSRQEKTYYN